LSEKLFGGFQYDIVGRISSKKAHIIKVALLDGYLTKR